MSNSSCCYQIVSSQEHRTSWLFKSIIISHLHTHTHTTSPLLCYYPYVSSVCISLHQRLLFLCLCLCVLITGLISLLLHIELQTITTHTNERFHLFVPFDKKLCFSVYKKCLCANLNSQTHYF